MNRIHLRTSNAPKLVLLLINQKVRTYGHYQQDREATTRISKDLLKLSKSRLKLCINRLFDHADRGVALKYINLLTSLKSNDPLVKRNRNAFFKHFLEVLENQLNIEARQKILCTCPVQHEEALSDPLKYLQKEATGTGEKVTAHWSKDKRSYVSVKIIPGRGALLYMACNNDPDCDWDIRETPKKT